MSKGVLPSQVIDTLDITLCKVFVTVVVPPTHSGEVVKAVIIVSVTTDFLFAGTPILYRVSSNFQVVVLAVLVTKVTTCFFPMGRRAGPRSGRSSSIRTWSVCMCLYRNDHRLSSPCTTASTSRRESRGCFCGVFFVLYALYGSNYCSLSNRSSDRHRCLIYHR